MSYKALILAATVVAVALSSACATATPPSPTVAPTTQPPSSTPTPPPPPSATPTAVPSPTDTPLPTETPLPTDTPTPEISPTPYTCSDQLGCLEVAPGEPLRIGYLLDLSGPAAQIGLEGLNALQLAAKMQVDLYGHAIELTGLDDQCQAEAGRAAGRELAGDATLAAVIGPTCSGAALAAVPWLSQAGLVVISPSNTNSSLTDPKSGKSEPGYFRTVPGDQWQGAAAARFAIQHLGVKTAATLYTKEQNLRLSNQFFVDEFIQLGGEVVTQVGLNIDQKNVAAAVAQIAKAAPEVVYLPLTLPSAVAAIQEIRKTSGLEDIPLVGPEHLMAPDLSDQAGLAADGAFLSRLDFNPPDDAYSVEFLPQYQAEYGDPTTFFVPFTVDAFRMLIAALGRVGVAYPDGRLYIPRQALREALYEVRGYPGLTGELSCTPNGDCGDVRNVTFFVNQVGIFPPSERVWP